MAHVWDNTPPRGRRRDYDVKNLGWLIAHGWEIDTITITRDGRGGAHMLARGPRYTFTCPWQSLVVCREWLKRPSLRHVAMEERVNGSACDATAASSASHGTTT